MTNKTVNSSNGEDHSKHKHTGPLTIILFFVIFLVVLMGVGYYYYNYHRPILRDVPAQDNASSVEAPAAI